MVKRLASQFALPFRTSLPGLLAAALLALVVTAQWSAAQLPLFRDLEAAVRDRVMRVLASDAEDPRIAIVDIDEESLRKLGAWPWPRERLADLSEHLLSEAAASRVILDLVLPGAENGAPNAQSAGDVRLAALAAAGVVILGQVFDYEQRDFPVQQGSLADGRELSNPATWKPAGTAGAGDNPSAERSAPSADATGFVANHAGLAGSRCVGNIGFQPDFDGQARKLPLWTAFEGKRYATLALATLACSARALDPESVAAELPVGPQGVWWVPFRRFPRAHLAVPAHEVLAGSTDLSGGLPLLRGRLVLVGSSALGLTDRLVTPLAPNVSGVFVHAEALSWLLDYADGQTITALPRGLMPAWALLSGLFLISMVANARLLFWQLAAGLLMSAALWFGLAAWGVRSTATDPLSTPVFAYALVLFVQLPVQWARAQSRLQQQTKILRRYVAPSVLAQLRRARSNEVLQPRRTPITVLIADMQDYTLHISRLSLEEAAALTKAFLGVLTEPILSSRGTLDRYTGDGVVAFWGAPIAEAAHADLALDAALQIVAQVTALNQKRIAEGMLPVEVRIGLASGEALVGDLGTDFRAAYTAVGDCINLASRLQQAARQLSVPILLDENVCSYARRHRFHAMGEIEVRGLAPQRVATLCGASREPVEPEDDPRAG